MRIEGFTPLRRSSNSNIIALMNSATNSYRFFPAVSDLSTLKPGTPVWIIQEVIFNRSPAAPAQRYFVGIQPSIGRVLLSTDATTLAHPLIYTGPIWTRRAGVLEELLEMARRRHFAAAAEVQRLEQEMATCGD